MATFYLPSNSSDNSGGYTTAKSTVNYRLKIEEGTFSASTRSKKVTVSLELWRTNTGYTTYGAGTTYLEFNGTEYSTYQNGSNPGKITYNSNTSYFTKDFTAYYNDDGTCNITVRGKIDLPTPGVTSGWQGGEVTLTKEAAKTYTVTYNANGATTGSTAAQTKVHGTDLKLQQNGYSLTNYKFIGWNTDASGTGTSYTAGGTYSKNENVTLYAQWALDTYIITFDNNGGAEGPSSQQINAAGGVLTIQTPKMTGYTFVGWDTSPDSITPVYLPGDQIFINSNITLYAIWDAWNYILTFDINGGYGTVPADVILLGSDKAIIGDERPLSTGSLAFMCWNTLPNGFGESYYPGDEFSAPIDGGIITLYAMYCNTDMYLNSDGTIECLEFIEDTTCDFPLFKKTGNIIAREFIEHDGEITIKGGLIFAKAFIEKARFLVPGGYKEHSMSTIIDDTGAIVIDTNGYIITGKFI
jgi:uncharacterized repeat protein (TIGR02543 family)